VERVHAAAAGGPLRSVAEQILDECRFASSDPRFARWLSMGAPSADARPAFRPRTVADDDVDPSAYCPIGQVPRLRGV